MRGLGRLGAVAVALTLLTSGCGFTGLYGKSLPGSVGGPLSSAKTYTVTVLFDDVLDLVPQSAVKVNDVTVGSVQSISLVPDPVSGKYLAQVVCKVKDSVHLPANTEAILEETSLLGEKFVQLQPPAAGASGRLAGGAVIRDGATSAYPDIEQVFGVLATVLNGGGLEKLQTINSELSAALAGREGKVRDVFRQLNTFVGGLDTQKQQITRAIRSLDKLAVDLNDNTGTIKTTLSDLAPGLAVIEQNRTNLVSLLQSLSRLGVVSKQVIDASVANTKTDLAALEPILTQLNKAGKALPGSLELLLDYPFPRDSTNGIPGDDTSLYASLDLSSACNLTTLSPQLPSSSGLAQLCSLLGISPGQGGLLPPLPGAGGTQRPQGSSPSSPALPSVPSVPSLPGGSGSTGLLGPLLGGLA